MNARRGAPELTNNSTSTSARTGYRPLLITHPVSRHLGRGDPLRLRDDAWELRVVLGTDPVTNNERDASKTVHGRRKCELRPAFAPVGPPTKLR